VEDKGVGASLGAAAVLAAVAGVAVGAGAKLTKNLGLSHQAEEMEKAKSGHTSSKSTEV